MEQVARIILIALSGVGFPVTQALIRRYGRAGAVATEAICAGLLAGDVVTIARGAHRGSGRLRSALLGLEVGAATVALVAGVPAMFDDEAAAFSRGWPRDAREILRRVSIGTLFGLRSWRFRTELRLGEKADAEAARQEGTTDGQRAGVISSRRSPLRLGVRRGTSPGIVLGLREGGASLTLEV